MKRLFAVLAACFLGLSFPARGMSTEPYFSTLTRRPTRVSKLPTAITIVTEDDIKKSGAQTLDEVLDSLPSIDVQKSGSLGSFSSVRIRGVPTSNQVQVVVDDQPIGGVGIQSIDISLIPVDNIERIEIVRGGSSVLYGANTIGGVIHIKTKKISEGKRLFSMRVENRSLGTVVATAKAGFNAGRGDVFIAGTGFNTDGYQQNAQARNRSGSVNAGYSFENGGRIGGEFFTVDQNQGTPSGTPVPFRQWNGELEKQANTPSSEIEKNASQGRLRFAWPVGSGLFQTVGYYGTDDFLLRSSPAASPTSKFENRIAGADTRFIFGGGLTAGASYERDRRESLGQDPHHVVNWGVYLQDDYDWEKWTISPAIRHDQHSTFGGETNPRLAIVYRAAENWKWSASAARTFRAPTLVDLFIVLVNPPPFSAFDFFGNPDLKPEIGWTYDLGTEIKMGDRAALSVTGFFTRLRNRIVTVDTDGNGFADTTDNAARAELSGVETVASLRTGPFRHQLNHTFQRAVGTSATDSRFVPLRLTPRHILNYSLEWRFVRSFRLINTVQYVGEQFQFDNDAGLRLEPYTLWQARLMFERDVWGAFIGVDNITDEIYAESFTFGNQTPVPGRVLSAGLTLRFSSE